MGIDIQTRPPVQRPPVQPTTLFFDAGYASSMSPSSDNPESPGDAATPRPRTATARLNGSQSELPPGTQVTIMTLTADSVTVWITAGTARCVAEVVGPEAEQLARACRVEMSGYVGTVVTNDIPLGERELQVQIDGI